MGLENGVRCTEITEYGLKRTVLLSRQEAMMGVWSVWTNSEIAHLTDPHLLKFTKINENQKFSGTGQEGNNIE